MATMKWEIGQTVEVQSRTWAGINKPGGCAKISKIHYNGKNIEGLDVKYMVGGGCEKQIDPSIVSAHELLVRGGRKRRGRDFLIDRAQDVVKQISKPKTSKVTLKSNTKEEPQQPPKNTTSEKPPAEKKKKKRIRLVKKAEVPVKTSQEPTPPSTPVTPEHKPVKVKKVPSVPSYIIAGQAMEVSPLPLGRSCAKQTKSAVAKRGLFGIGVSVPKQPKNVGTSSKSKVDDMEEKKQPAAVAQKIKASSSEEVTRRNLNVVANKNETAKKKQGLPATKDKPRFPAAGKSDNLNIARRKPVDDQKPAPKPILQFPRPKPANHNRTKSGSRKALKDVYDHECQKVKKFVSEVVGAPSDDIINSKENLPSTPVKAEKKPSPPSRNEQFLSIFRSLRLKIDDGTIEETEFRKLVNQQASKSFSVDEVDAHVEKLCEEGKIMKSDGTIYIID
jgi:hypothetical protein